MSILYEIRRRRSLLPITLIQLVAGLFLLLLPSTASACKDKNFDGLNGYQYSCPDGYKHHCLYTVNDKKVCQKKGKVVYRGADRWKCSKPGGWGVGKCWKCPSGYRRNGLTKGSSSRACKKKSSTQYSKAIRGKKFDMRVGVKYTHVPNAAISGCNDLRVVKGSVSDCKSACTFNAKCVSFDYDKQKRACDLSTCDANKSGLKRDYSGDRYDHYSKRSLKSTFTAASAKENAREYFDQTSAPRTRNTNWMKYIPDNASLAKISIPGTHDSGALHGGIGGEFAAVQSWSIKEQLEAGIRYLDIRARPTGTSFAIHHGPFYQKQMFGDVLETVKAFLKAHPTETILMRVKSEHKAQRGSEDFGDIWARYMAKYDALFYKGVEKADRGKGYEERVPSLGVARGKIVLIRDQGEIPIHYGVAYGDQSRSGHYKISHLAHEFPKHKGKSGSSVGEHDGVTMVTKRRFVMAAIDARERDQSPDKLQMTSFSGNIPGIPSKIAAQLNQELYNHLGTYRTKTGVGVVIMDWPGTGLIRRIIDHNKKGAAARLGTRMAIKGHHSEECVTNVGGKLAVAPCSDDTAHIVDRVDREHFRLRHVGSDRCLYSNRDGRYGYGSCKFADQYWKKNKRFGSSYSLRSKHSGKCLYSNKDGRKGRSKCVDRYSDQHFTFEKL